MSKVLFADDAASTLAVGIAIGATSCTVGAGTGARFPAPNPATGTYFYATFVKASDATVKEIVKCTGRVTDTFTITPTVNAWNAGDTFALLNAAEGLDLLVQQDDLQNQSGNYALDTGAANAYVVNLTPALSAPVPGMPVRFLASNANTGPSKLNGLPLVHTDGSALVANDIVKNGLYEATWNQALAAYQLNWQIVASFSQLQGQIQDDQVPADAVLQFLTEILANAALTGVPTAPTAADNTNSTQIASTAFANRAASEAAAAAANIPGQLASPGFQPWLSGFKVQFGVLNSTGGQVPVGFPQAFNVECIGVQFTPTIGGFTAGLVSRTTNGFVADTFQTGGGGQAIYWFAYGH